MGETEERKAMNQCYRCIHRRKVPGSAHSSCAHPSLERVNADPMLKLGAIFASVGRAPPQNVSTNELNIKANSWGVKHGWFNFPWNFDPVWLLNCDGFEEAEAPR